MTVTHLDARGVALCSTAGRVVGPPSLVTCTRCHTRVAKAREAEHQAWAARRYQTRLREACRSIGLEDAWESVAASDNAHDDLIRNMLGHIALYVVDLRARNEQVAA